MDLSAFRPLNPFKWRSSLSGVLGTRPPGEQVPNPATQTATTDEGELQKQSEASGASDSLAASSGTDNLKLGAQDMFRRQNDEFNSPLNDFANFDQQNIQYHRSPPVVPVDPVEKVEGMYRLLDLISESGSNGYVDKVIIAQDSVQRFIHSVSPGAYASITKVDFNALDRFVIKPLGVYGSKDEIVRLLQSMAAIDNKTARLLLTPIDASDSRLTLSSGLYILRANTLDLTDERHYVIYWPEDTTWNDSATSSVRRNRVTFMRYLTKICDQVVALLSLEHSTAIVWSDQDSDAESVDVDTDTDRLFTFEVAETNEQEENAVARTGFQMNSRYIVPYDCPPNCPVDPAVLAPCLFPGETTQGFFTRAYIPRQLRSEAFDELTLSRVSLQQLLMENAVVLSVDLEEKAVQTLVNVVIEDLFPEACDNWRAANQDIHAKYEQELVKRKDTISQEIAKGEDSLLRILREVVVEDVMTLFPSLLRDDLFTSAEDCASSAANQGAGGPMRLSDLESLYPGFRNVYKKYFDNARFDTALRRNPRFESRKLRLISIRYLLDHNQPLDTEAHAELIRTILFEGNFRRAQQAFPRGDEKKRSGLSSWAVGSLFSSSGSSEDSLEKEMRTLAARIPDAHFLFMMKSEEDEALRPVLGEVEELAHTQLRSSIDVTVKTMVRAVSAMQQTHCQRSIQLEMESEERKSRSKVLVRFIQDINSRAIGRQDSVVYLDGIIAYKSIGLRDGALYDRPNTRSASHSSSYQGFSSRYGQEYVITGRRQVVQESKLEICVHLMDLTSDDKHNMQLDPNYIPSPAVNDRLSSHFCIPVTTNIAFYQVLENGRLLLVLINRDKVSIYLDRLPAMNAAILRDRPVKTLNREKLGGGIILSFDETTRSLAVCASTKLQLHLFVFDESYKTLQVQGSAINLAPWYSKSGIAILHAAFVCGNEEIALVDSTAQVRIFSFVTLQFRPASLQLPSLPQSIFSSPDGSCLLVLHIQGSESSLMVYHWESFGSTAGIHLAVPEFPLQGAVLTSMVNRGRIFLMGLDVNSGSVQSVAIDITKRLTEFMFRENGGRNASNNKTRHTLHNSLLDCHAEVWSRFPVVAAVKRRTVTSSSHRKPRGITFIAENHSQPFDSYFSDLIMTFERSTRKPTGDELRRIKVSAKDFTSFWNEVTINPEWDVSRYRVGEWLVDLLCLIPIHIAVCRENRFVPLADGVLSSDLERSLLGAEVSKIVDKLSFGWYESIFQSYLATKPVKVVSSMGQQSVGKSFSLNHLLDTSFAGSAMRTTEGVWMSVTPTDDALIVALDFEGVDSVERSLQEDTLLVLFNTAISNLVLFRNNFAFSRDISGLFQSFQSSASVLDPAANPSLFQSTLVIIIKDVVEADKVEITREFSLKFQKIVQQEQGSNFISRLHRGKLDIIPWPVIESKEFYKLFSTLKKRLDSQKISHPTAGEFLHTIKTLMAKLKANDWGALSQTMADHRARTLFASLPVALTTGYSEVEPDFEPLKNFDTDAIVGGDDTPARFAISEREEVSPADIEMHLATLRESWDAYSLRKSMPDADWTAKLASYIGGLIELRVNHVRLWLDSNLERFQADHAAVEDLRRRFGNMVIEMRANAQLCKAQCASCHLLCIRSRLHDGDHSCETTHECEHSCAFCEDQQKPCGIPAGHPGEHVCAVNAHLCGGPCMQSGRQGCLQDCTKVAGHVEDEHMCSALIHMCGEPCALQEMKLQGKTYTCQEGCSMPSDRPHNVHSCAMRLCPVACDLCKRLCVQPHLHGLETDSSHLCGESHPCSALCSASGICQIDTTPLSIEATFTGRHETFQYTKYSQVSKRLQCVKAIDPGQTSHAGAHTHTKEEQPFHFCETRCKNCGYFCTLPLGHTQQEHETSHGSMTQTHWAIEGPDADIELGGRKFSANDEGAPMMCNLVCSSMGRHAHIDYCRAVEGALCEGAEMQHINARMVPNPDRPKDAITHGLHWRRMGFKDPYTRDEQTTFSKCDAMCSGPEHSTTASGSAQPSYCTLPVFHPLRRLGDPVNGQGYVSNDGHLFGCKNPIESQQAFHVIFIIDRSASMSIKDRLPLADGPVAERIRQFANNRLGAVYSALYSFWTARHAAITVEQQSGARRGVDSFYSTLYNLLSVRTANTVDRNPGGGRRDAYSVVLFDDSPKTVLTNDLTSDPDQLLNILLAEGTGSGTNFRVGLRASESIMLQHWSTERAPVMIFLSDGECSISDRVIQDICRSAIQHGKPLSFHSVSFGKDASAAPLRKMADLALAAQNGAPRGVLLAAGANVPSSFSTALDTIRLTETFLGIAESLRKPRGSLMH